MTANRRQGAGFYGCLGLLLLVAGCQEETSVKGTVTYNGQPLARGILSLVPTGEGPGEGAKILNGAYQIDSLRPGPMKFGVRGELGGASGDGPVTSENKRAALAARESGELQQVPADAKGNGEVHEIVVGPQTIDIELTGPLQ